MLRACDRRRATGRRDYAVILLILRLGLRANEVATLRLDDLDWRAGQLTVHGKGNRVDQLPLPVDVGEAIAAYLCRGRPRSADGAGGVPAGAAAARWLDACRGELPRRGGSASRRAWRGAPPSAAPHRGHRHAAGGRVAARDRPGPAPPLAWHHRHLRAGRCRAAARHRPALAVGGGVMSALADHLDDYLRLRRGAGLPARPPRRIPARLRRLPRGQRRGDDHRRAGGRLGAPAGGDQADHRRLPAQRGARLRPLPARPRSRPSRSHPRVCCRCRGGGRRPTSTHPTRSPRCWRATRRLRPPLRAAT